MEPIFGLRQRRQKLAATYGGPVLLWSGGHLPRNFPANVFPLRASSHFLYFAGVPLRDGVLYLHRGDLILFLDPEPAGAALWHGPQPTPETVAERIGATAVYPLADLPRFATGAATIPIQEPLTRSHQERILGRSLPPAHELTGEDGDLAAAIVALRLHHDDLAIAELHQAAAATVQAHRAGMNCIPQATTEAQVRGAIEGALIAQGCTPSYTSIVTTRGEVLHQDTSPHPLTAGDLLLVDAGAETANGWAGDVTRTYPVSGRFSPSQRDLYQVVLAAHDACITALRPGVEYRAIHRIACEVLTSGLVELGILRGDPAELVADNVHSLFFPHGVGHLLGLDVHDMEDLGDRAGYAPGRVRDDRFGWCFLRLDRPLAAGMVVTIEPGFYQVPGILADPENRKKYGDRMDWRRLAQFGDVRGIRIEDDVLITPQGCQVLTQEIPVTLGDLEAQLSVSV